MLIVILIVYIILGCFLDSLSMMLITLPIFFPLIVKLGYDPIWFGILVTSVVEIGLITPPVGMNLFVIVSVAERIKVRDRRRRRGAVPVADRVRLVLLVDFSHLALLLPQVDDGLTMEFGIQFFPAVGPKEKDAARYFEECLVMAEQAEALGFTHARTVEHYFNLTAATARTRSSFSRRCRSGRRRCGW